jgi:hypothetical protein
MTPEGKPGSRRYGAWAGSPKGRIEDTSKCAEQVRPDKSWVQRQCSRERGYGPNQEYCKMHAKKYEAK